MFIHCLMTSKVVYNSCKTNTTMHLLSWAWKKDFSFVSNFILCECEQTYMTAIQICHFSQSDSSCLILSVDDPHHNTDPCLHDGGLSAWFVVIIIQLSDAHVLAVEAALCTKAFSLTSVFFLCRGVAIFYRGHSS